MIPIEFIASHVICHYDHNYPHMEWPIFMCFTIKYRLNREYSSPANRTLKTNLDRPSKKQHWTYESRHKQRTGLWTVVSQSSTSDQASCHSSLPRSEVELSNFRPRPIFHKWVPETLAKQVLLLTASTRVSVRHAESSPSAPRYNKSGNYPGSSRKEEL